MILVEELKKCDITPRGFQKKTGKSWKFVQNLMKKEIPDHSPAAAMVFEAIRQIKLSGQTDAASVRRKEKSLRIPGDKRTAVPVDREALKQYLQDIGARPLTL